MKRKFITAPANFDAFFGLILMMMIMMIAAGEKMNKVYSEKGNEYRVVAEVLVQVIIVIKVSCHLIGCMYFMQWELFIVNRLVNV